MEGGAASALVAVWGNGRGASRRQYGEAKTGFTTLQAGTSAWQRQGAGAWVRLPASSRPRPQTDAGRIVRNYLVTAGPATSLLNRTVTPIRIDRKRPFTPFRRLWVEAETGLILKDDLYGPDGRLRSSTVFTDLRIGPQPPALFAPPASTAPLSGFGPSSFRPSASRAEAERLSGRSAPSPRYTPPGFTVEMYGVMTTRHGTYMPAVRFADGLAAYTIFRRGPGAGRMGAGGPASDNQRAVVISSRPQGNYLLVGDIAESELRKVANSLP
jgi:negative regulator of sigma E activity